MKLEYSVHSAVRGETEFTVSYNGKDRTVRGDALVVELVADGSVLTLRLDDVEAAEKLFKVGKPVTLTISGGK